MCDFQQHASVTPVTIIRLSCNKNTINIQVQLFVYSMYSFYYTHRINGNRLVKKNRMWLNVFLNVQEGQEPLTMKY
jgi:hypothetical protein